MNGKIISSTGPRSVYYIIIIRNNERRLFWHVRAREPGDSFECVSMICDRYNIIIIRTLPDAYLECVMRVYTRGGLLSLSEHFRPSTTLPTRTSCQVVSGVSSTGSSSLSYHNNNNYYNYRYYCLMQDSSTGHPP